MGAKQREGEEAAGQRETCGRWHGGADEQGVRPEGGPGHSAISLGPVDSRTSQEGFFAEGAGVNLETWDGERKERGTHRR